MRLFRSLALGAALATLSLASLPIHAETDPAQESNRLTRPSDAIGTIGDGLFGDSVDLYNGTTTFDVTDISIPGNSKLPVALGRHLDAVGTDLYGGLQSFANWEVDVPYLTGYFAEAGWTGTAGGQLDGSTPTLNRCSLDGGTALAIPPTIYKQQSFYGRDYWSGNQMHVPGQGTQEMLVNNSDGSSPHPSSGPAAHWITRNLWTFSCLSAMSDGSPGEGFLATSPDGTQYYFDRMATQAVSNAATFFYYTLNGTQRSGTFNRQKNWILASHAVDRFGNRVDWNYNTSNQLTSITANDGRSITLVWNADGTIHTASDGTHTWTYGYTAYTPDPNDAQNPTRLTSVTLPDNSAWSYGYTGILVMVDTTPWTEQGPEPLVTCDGPPIANGRHAGATAYPYTPFTLTATHPSGASGVFVFKPLIRGRSYDPHKCTGANPMYPKQSEQFALFNKTLSGPGLPTSTWTYTYSPPNDSWSADCSNNSCPSTVWTNVANPDGSEILSTFGNKYGVTEGQLQDVSLFTDSTHTTVLDEATTTYWGSATGQPFPQYIGISPQFRANIFLSQEQHPQLTHSQIRDGVTFTSAVNAYTGTQVTGYDAYANPLSTTRSSSLGSSRTDVATFDDNTNLWVLEQPKTLTNANTGAVVYSKNYDSTTALLQNTSSNGLLEASYTYFTTDDSHHQKGLLNTITEGTATPAHVTTLGNYYRGIPQSVQFPDTASKAAVVDGYGHITGLTDEMGYAMGFAYDPMGRLATITQPTSDSVAWQPTNITFAPVSSSEFGLPAGHWKQTETTGNATKITYFDGFWQPVLTQEYDGTNAGTIAATARYTNKGFDFAGRTTFASYPLATFSGAYNSSTVKGVHTYYDGLGRPTTSTQDSELKDSNLNPIPLVTSYAYLPGFQTQVTNPRNQVTTTSYQVFDSPDTSHPTSIVAPLGATTTIARDVFGKPTALTRTDTNTGTSVTRSYVYDTHQRLCKRVEPETGATLMDYDLSNNIAWTVTGSTLTVIDSATQCEGDRASVPTTARTVRSYDMRNRVLTVDIPNTTNDLAYSYFYDGALQTLTSGTNIWTYTYNKRRLPVTENLAIDGRSETITHNYDALGHENQLFYPDGLVINTTANALGQPNQAGTYATGVSYFPNGGMSGFTYHNGIVHTLTQNTRELPLRSLDQAPGGAVLDDTYTYDKNGNVTEIDDGTTGNPNNRTMTYDGLDRLILTTASNQPWITAHTTYDALDNLLTNYVGGRHYDYSYDTNNRLSQLTNHGNGAVTMTLGYDANGNVTSKGNNQDSYLFDAANRLQTVIGPTGGKESYVYDGYGRRVKVTRTTDGLIDYPVYTMSGQLLTEDDARTNKTTDYISLNGSLVAKRSATIGGNTWTTTYEHTDALHSPITETDATGASNHIERYTPYGEPGDGSYTQGPGYTGHVTDAFTGLTYAQQRYYDPILGGFLSVDPIVVDTTTATNFCRYCYAADNPYTFIDPDGRETDVIINANTHLSSPETWFGKHAGFYLSHGDKQPFLYDPNGSYHAPGIPRGEAGAFEGAEANLGAYLRFQFTDGKNVHMYRFDTTPAEEKEIVDRIMGPNSPDQEDRGFTCASQTSGMLNGVGPFKNLGTFTTPSGLEKRLQQLQKEQKTSSGTSSLEGTKQSAYRQVDDHSVKGTGSSGSSVTIWQ